MFRPEDFNNGNDDVSFNPDNVIHAMPSFVNQNFALSQDVANSISQMNQQKFEARQAQIDAAKDISVIRENTTDIIENQKHLIDSQKEYINSQKEIIEQLKYLNDTQTQQFQRLKEIFYSIEDGTAVNKETMTELKKLVELQPVWSDFIKDKGADVVIGAILALMPMLLRQLGVFL